MSSQRTLSEQEITDCTGARVDTSSGEQDKRYQVQLDGMWIDVDFDAYERVRQIQDSCA
jgi:hypothetical protein